MIQFNFINNCKFIYLNHILKSLNSENIHNEKSQILLILFLKLGNNNSVYTLSGNVTLNSNISIPMSALSDATFDGGGYTITYIDDDWEGLIPLNTSIIIQNINLDLGNNNIKKYYGGIMDYDHDNK